MIFPIVLALALFFDFLNGFHDSSNIVATAISSRALQPRVALLIAALCHFISPFIFGVAVATTIGKGLLNPDALQMKVVIAALISAVLWNLATWYLGLPSSSSHALIGGLLGASVLSRGIDVVQPSGLIKIVVVLLVSPPIGLLFGYIFMRVTLWSVRGASPSINRVFRRLQILTLIGLSLSHGTNDAQKTMGVISLGLMLSGGIDTFRIPLWVVAVSAGAIAFGTSLGGWRLIRTLGGRMYRIRPIHGFSSQVAGASVILGASLVGGPVSTTQVMSSAIMGTGAAERMSKVRWTILRDLVIAWVLTIPATAALSSLAWVALTRYLT